MQAKEKMGESLKKLLTKVVSPGNIYKHSVETETTEKIQKEFLKEIKKVVDKQNKVRYTNRVADEESNREEP